MTVQIPFDNTYAALPEGLYARQKPTPVAAPELIAFNADLAKILGVTQNDLGDVAQVFGGNALPEGAAPIAQLYSGHQFGQYNPQLGDGRAILLGEVIDHDGQRRDIQLKGSGQTPFSRRGDGRAWLGPVLREYVVSEAMHALGIPTTRALAAVSTGETVLRETPLPGAVLTRVAASHIRVGTFQVFSARRDLERLKTLYDYTVARHYPAAKDPHDLLDGVIQRQAELVAKWMGVGFIHGVMNTDNCTLSGETIDYGPCAFMDSYDPETVFSSIDRYGRYAYIRQPDIIVWNMAQLATALVPLMDDTDAAVERFTEQVHAMPALLRDEYERVFAAKIGITDAKPEDISLVTDLLSRMHENTADFTNTFRGLVNGNARDQFDDPMAFDQWSENWQARLAQEPTAQDVMRGANPAIIPRNHRIEEMIAQAVEGDYALFHRLNAALATPYQDLPENKDLTQAPRPDERVQATFCGT